MGTTMNMLLKNGRVIDPSCGRDLQTDILIRDGKIAEIGTCDPAQAECILDCTGMIAAPGLIDAHVHLRDPGLSYKASIATDTYAAAKGGVTHVVAMANVIPVPHTVSAHQMIMERSQSQGHASCQPDPEHSKSKHHKQRTQRYRRACRFWS